VLKSKTLHLFAGVENLLDQNYWQHLDWGQIPRPGRNIYAQIRFDF
jgi:iron complex outermembrane receptor protein